MSSFEISWVAVAVASLLGFTVAMVWYSDWGLVGPAWRGLTGVTASDSKRAGLRPFVVLAVAIVATAVALAAACALATAAVGRRGMAPALLVAVVAWLGFSATTLAQHNGFEQKPTRLTIINATYQLVLFLGMGVTIGFLQR